MSGLADESSDIKLKLREVLRLLQKIDRSKKSRDVGNILKLYDNSASKIVQGFLIPLTQRLLPTLPEARDRNFYDIGVTGPKNANNVRFSRMCSTVSVQSPRKSYILYNCLVTTTLLLLRLLDLCVGQEKYHSTVIIISTIYKLSAMHYDVSGDKRGSMVFHFVLFMYVSQNFYKAHAASTKAKGTQTTKESDIVGLCVDVENSFLIRDQKIYNWYEDDFYVSLVKDCADKRRIWQMYYLLLDGFCKCIADNEEMATSGTLALTKETSFSTVKILYFCHRGFMELGDLFLASVSSWFSAKMHMLISHFVESSYPFKSLASECLTMAESLEEASASHGERYAPFHETLLHHGPIVRFLLGEDEADEQISASIVQLFASENCDDHLMAKVAIASAKKVGFTSQKEIKENNQPFDFFDRILLSEDRLTRKDFMNVLMCLRLITPRVTAIALDVILCRYQSLLHQYKDQARQGGTEETTLKLAFKNLVLSHSILVVELLIQNKSKGIHPNGKYYDNEAKVLQNAKTVTERLLGLEKLLRNDEQNSYSSEPEVPRDTPGYFSLKIATREISIPCLPMAVVSQVLEDKLAKCIESSMQYVDETPEMSLLFEWRQPNSMKLFSEIEQGDSEKNSDADLRRTQPKIHNHRGNGGNPNRMRSRNNNLLETEEIGVAESEPNSKKNCNSLCKESSAQAMEGSFGPVNEGTIETLFGGTIEEISLVIEDVNRLPIGRVKILTIEDVNNLPIAGVENLQINDVNNLLIEGGYSSPSDEIYGSSIDEVDGSSIEDIDEEASSYSANSESSSHQTIEEHRRKMELLRTSEEAFSLCRLFQLDLAIYDSNKNLSAKLIHLIDVLKKNLIECLMLLIKQTQSLSVLSEDSDAVTAREDEVKLKDLLLKLMKPAENELEHLITWMEN